MQIVKKENYAIKNVSILMYTWYKNEYSYILV